MFSPGMQPQSASTNWKAIFVGFAIVCIVYLTNLFGIKTYLNNLLSGKGATPVTNSLPSATTTSPGTASSNTAGTTTPGTSTSTTTSNTSVLPPPAPLVDIYNVQDACTKNRCLSQGRVNIPGYGSNQYAVQCMGDADYTNTLMGGPGDWLWFKGYNPVTFAHYPDIPTAIGAYCDISNYRFGSYNA
jgi:hypothetical protein